MKDISFGMFFVLCTGVLLWVVYGVLIRSLPVILTNAVTFVLAFSILALRIRYG